MTDRRVLVVEDDPDGQEFVAVALENMGFTVDVTDNGERATEMLFAGDPHYSAIVIDLALPGMDGWELLTRILANPATQNTPCIAVTAFHNFKLREQALSAGFTAYFPKPIDSTSLGREINRLI
jgi:CheY-like chemotaxis protein